MAFDPFADELIHGDKYAAYRTLRDTDPVPYNERWDCWAVSRFADVWQACESDALSVAKGTTTAHLLTKVQPVTPMLNSMDPPEHSRLRGQIRAFFMPRRVRALDSVIRGVVLELIAGFEASGACEFVDDFAQPLATHVGCTVIGLPPEDADLLRSFVSRFFERDPATEGMTQDGLAAMAEMNRYLADLSAARRRRPADPPDPIAVLHAWQSDSGARLSDEDVASHLSLLLIGGTDTLPKVLANLLLRLAQHPDQRRDLTADPELALGAFNEAVRIDMPTQMMGRSLTRDLEIGGKTLRKGQPILLLYACANRDEREFERPDAFDMRRRPARSLSFSHGAHACIGLHLARREGEIAIRELLARFPDYTIDESGLERYATEFVQGYSKMPVRWRP